MAFHFSPKIVTEGIVLYLDGANGRSYTGTGSSWFDLSSNKYSGSLINGPTFDQKYLGNILFDGTNDYINFGTGGNENVRGLTAMTISAACYCTGYSNPGVVSWAPIAIIDRFNLGTSFRKFALYFLKVTSSLVETVECEFFDGIGGSVGLSYSTSPLNNFIFVTTTVDSSSSNLYINGQLVDSSSGLTVNSNPQTADFTIGSRINTSYNGNFKGNISSVLIYNRALSSDEVSQNFNVIKTRFGF
jgi:hypothetical protein